MKFYSDKEINKIISNSLISVQLRLQILEVESLIISDYNKEYLKKYKNNYSYYSSLYSQLLKLSIKSLTKSIEESVFVDYGGGIGLLSLLAKDIGFKSVIYNDIYDISVNDFRTISKEINLSPNEFICGDIDQFVDYINNKKIKPDLICSFDVLEHIYNLDLWFDKLYKIDNSFVLYFMTSANPKNLFVANRLKKMQIKSELIGNDKTKSWKIRDTSSSFLQIRKQIIKKINNELNDNEINMLATKTRGLIEAEIEKIVNEYLVTKKINYKIKHKTNTCDPITGNWVENLINLKALKNIIKSKKMNVEIFNAYYSYSTNKLLNIFKFFLNILIFIFGKKCLFFSPTYTLKVEKQQ